jgi:hypothetical protein
MYKKLLLNDMIKEFTMKMMTCVKMMCEMMCENDDNDMWQNPVMMYERLWTALSCTKVILKFFWEMERNV